MISCESLICGQVFMNSKETVFTAMERGKPPRVPATWFGGGAWSIHNSGTTFKELSEDPERMARMNIEIYREFKQDIVYVGSGYNNFHGATLGGVIKFRDVGVPDLETPYINEISDIERLDLGKIENDPVIQTIHKATRIVKEEIGDEAVVCMTAWAPFTLAGQMVGMEKFMRAMFKDKDLVHAACELAVKMLKAIFEPVVDDGTLDLISIADGYASGDVISRKQFEKFVLPYIKEMTSWGRSKNKKTLLHICGDTKHFMDLFPETGADCASLDCKVDLAKIKAVIGGEMCFAGNINPVATLDQGDAAQVRKAASECLKIGAPEGGYIMMPGCDLPPSVPAENIKAFLETAKNYTA